MSETKELKYNEPWILQRADPYVYRHTDGMYYFTASLPEYNGIALRRASTLAGLADAEETMIWKKHDKGIMSVHIWIHSSCDIYKSWPSFYKLCTEHECIFITQNKIAYKPKIR